MPDATQFKAWRIAVRQEITAASGRGDEAFAWALKVEAESATLDSLFESEGFDSLDAKLSSALAKVASGELGRRITHMMEVQAQAGKMVKGRQILWMIYQQFRLSEEAGAMYDFSDIMAVRLKG